MTRKEKIASLLKVELSKLIQHTLNDSRIGFISITDVTLSKDFREAFIYYSQIGTDEEKLATRKGLSSATKFLHGELSKMIRYMAIPKLKFRFDSSLEKGVELVDKIDSLNSH